jgi:hypothetical protein
MDMPAEELTDAEIENLFAKGVVKATRNRFLWHVGTAVTIGFLAALLGFLAALLLSLSGVPASDSTRRGDFAEAKIREDCAAKKIPGC